MSAPNDEELDALAQERQFFEMDEKTQAERLFTEALPAAVVSLIDIAKYGQKERNRLVASQYIIERNLGRLQDATTNTDDPFERLLAECVSEHDASKAEVGTQGNNEAGAKVEGTDPKAASVASKSGAGNEATNTDSSSLGELDTLVDGPDQ